MSGSGQAYDDKMEEELVNRVLFMLRRLPLSGNARLPHVLTTLLAMVIARVLFEDGANAETVEVVKESLAQNIDMALMRLMKR